MIIYLNGGLLPASEARIDPADRGLTLGDGLFETISAVDGAPLRLAAHFARLRRGAEILAIPLRLTDEALGAAMRATLNANAVKNGVIRLTLTRGPAPRGLLPPPDVLPTLMIAVCAGTGAASAPLTAVIAAVTRRNEHSPLARCKSLNCLDNILARQEAAKRGVDEAILLNAAGRLAETAVANLFVVIDGRLMTPPVAEGALPGVMRAEILATADAEERPLEPEVLAQASEAFVTNSLGLRPLVSVDDQPIGDGRPGPVFKAIQKNSDFAARL